MTPIKYSPFTPKETRDMYKCIIYGWLTGLSLGISITIITAYYWIKLLFE